MLKAKQIPHVNRLLNIHAVLATTIRAAREGSYKDEVGLTKLVPCFTIPMPAGGVEMSHFIWEDDNAEAYDAIMKVMTDRKAKIAAELHELGVEIA